MESRIISRISHPVQRTKNCEYKNRKRNKRKADNRRTCEDTKRIRSTNECDGQRIPDGLTDLDEAERLCLPNYKFVQTSLSDNVHDYPKHYNVEEYRKLTTAVDRRKYRNSRDLRNNIKKPGPLEQPDHSENRLCYAQLRGQKCENTTCLFKHEFRIPRKFRLCSNWKKGFCANGPCCLYLHAEFPCCFHYLGLKSARHDPKTCRYHHGGPLPKEYEDMFLDSIDLKKYPMSREMYTNRRIELELAKRNTEICVSGSTEQQEVVNCAVEAVESVTEKSLEVNVTKDGAVSQQNDPESSDESGLLIDEGLMD